MRHRLAREWQKEMAVSIHASVKDATMPSPSSCLKTKVSIHASVKDATDNTEEFVPPYMFQSTHL